MLFKATPTIYLITENIDGWGQDKGKEVGATETASLSCIPELGGGLGGMKLIDLRLDSLL